MSLWVNKMAELVLVSRTKATKAGQKCKSNTLFNLNPDSNCRHQQILSSSDCSIVNWMQQRWWRWWRQQQQQTTNSERLSHYSFNSTASIIASCIFIIFNWLNDWLSVSLRHLLDFCSALLSCTRLYCLTGKVYSITINCGSFWVEISQSNHQQAKLIKCKTVKRWVANTIGWLQTGGKWLSVWLDGFEHRSKRGAAVGNQCIGERA